MKLLNDLEERLKPSLINGDINQARNLLKRLKLTLTKKGYCLEFENDIVTLDAFVRQAKKDFERDHPTTNIAWHCAACGYGNYKLIDGRRQCQLCFEIETE